MANTASKFFSVMVIGENHKEIMAKYSMDLETEPYVKYEYLKADKYLDNAIKALNNILSNADTIGIDGSIKNSLSERINILKKFNSIYYFYQYNTIKIFSYKLCKINK